MSLFRHGKKTRASSGASSSGGLFQGTASTRQRQQDFLRCLDEQTQEVQSAQAQSGANPQVETQSGVGAEDQLLVAGEEDLSWDTDEEDAEAVSSSSFRYAHIKYELCI